MTPLNTYIQISFKDDAGRTTNVSYPLLERLDSAFGNIDDVWTAMQGVYGIIANMTNSGIDRIRLIVDWPGISPADDASNNQIVAFTRVTFDDGTVSAIEIPSWDASNYPQDEHNMIGGDWPDYIEALASLLAHPDTWEQLSNGDLWTQSRARKGRQTVG